MSIAKPRERAAKRVTINDLARSLGIAKGTVSRALNGYPDISETTRVRVTRAAERMGYRPLAQAQAIRTGRARSLGLVLNAGGDAEHRPFLTDFLDGISRAASEESWTLSVATAHDVEDEVATMARLIDERKVDGFILPRTRLHDARIDLLRDLDVPFVLFGRTADPTGCAWYDISGEDAMTAAVQRLAHRGHRRIGFINGALEYTYAGLREGGYRAGLADARLPFDPALMVDGATTMAEGEVQGECLLDLAEPPTAIVCALDLAALGVYRAAARRGLRIGPDLAVISYDGIPEGATATPPLTTYAVDSRAAGARLAKLLFARIRGTDPERLRELAPARLIARASDVADFYPDPAAALGPIRNENNHWED
ncbi:substrate-binding domain-containing protein [Fontisubflavum oceani]|uniref:LacI family DNA-binding transcriptional regulator n=1 Tax=Fontisubflavum oceani TaxID=2978973 RepID=UPI0025B2EA60|nr:substrate-binding domain-containing protein [Fontisubflavum oceani]WJY20149.1 substrate-binding domain-containing protein [Fontisubflavum oceani]